MISIITSLFLKTHHGGLDVILVVSLASVVGLALATVLILEYPFSGSIAVSSDPLVQGRSGRSSSSTGDASGGLGGNLTPDQI